MKSCVRHCQWPDLLVKRSKNRIPCPEFRITAPQVEDDRTLATYKLTGDSAIAEGPRDAPCQWKSCQLLHNCIEIPFEKASNRWMTLTVIQGHRNCRCSIGYIYTVLPSLSGSMSVSFLIQTTQKECFTTLSCVLPVHKNLTHVVGPLECRAVTLPRRETRWNLQGCPKLANGSHPPVGRSSPY